MKRVKSACMMQTLHFILDPNVSEAEAIEKVKNEVASYKANGNGQVQILEEKHLDDGTVLMSVKKRVSGYDVGNYFD